MKEARVRVEAELENSIRPKKRARKNKCQSELGQLFFHGSGEVGADAELE